MESTDDSFAWTTTSSDTSDSDCKGNNMIIPSHTKAEDGDSTDNKKKLQKRLFEKEPGWSGEEPPRKRKKKLKREREKSPPSPHIKHESDSEADAELAYRVKQEQASHNTTAADIGKANGIDYHAAATSESEFANSDRKSKKSKKRKRNSSLNMDIKDMIVEDMFSAEETVVEERQTKASENISQKSHKKSISKESVDTYNKNGTTYSSKEFISHDSSSSDENDERKKKRKKKRKKSSEPQEVDRIGSNSDGTGSHAQETSFQSVQSSHKKTKISDLIQYEEENSQTDNQNTTNGDRINTATQSSRVKRFIKSNPHLKAITTCVGNKSLITRDDEVWMLKCPHEVDISSLRGKDLHLDAKCKLKIDGQAYDGSMNEERGSVAILSCANNQIVINSVSLMGTVNFHKRLPKPHFFEDNVIVHNQTNFTPLPDTKRRHPLFGTNYKKAMKIPSEIKKRLKAANEPQQEPSEKKKKKRHREKEYVEEPAAATHEPYKKKKKHRLPSEEEDDAPPRKRSKKIKNKVSDDTWESEKAIEESLFNF